MSARVAPMAGAEWRKLWARGFATSALVLTALFSVGAFLVVLGVHYLRKWSADRQPGQFVANVFDAADVGYAELTGLWWVPVVQLAVLAVSAECFASEYALGTYRTLLLRPVPRWAVLAAKGAACVAFTGLVVVGPVALGTALGVVPFGLDRADQLDPSAPASAAAFGARLGLLALGAAAHALAFLPLVALAAALAVLTRSSALAFASSLVLLAVDLASALTLPTLADQLSQPALRHAARLTLHASRSACTGYAGGADWLAADWPRLLGTLAWTAGLAGLATVLFRRQDIE